MMNFIKKRVLFIGSFADNTAGGVVGGQMFACKSLIQSSLSDCTDWVLIDTTAESNGHISYITRIRKALFRLSKFIYHILFSRIDICLIFTADGFSFLEKGLASLIGKLFGKKVILAPRSGIIIKDVKDSKLMKIFISYILDKVDIVICQGETWRQFYSQLLVRNFNKLSIIQNWIDTSVYNSNEIVENKETCNVLFLAWVDKKKGIFDLIKAASLINSNLSKYHIAGDGLAMEEAKKMVVESGLENQFIFHGWVKNGNKIKLLQDSDIFVLPSYYEGFPNSLMEAMACRNAIVATNVGSIPDLIQHKHNGLLFQAGDISALKIHLETLMANSSLRNQLANAALVSVKDNNSIQIAVKKFEKIFNSQLEISSN
ncbi:MAG: glycosyltransferase family 4 protein [Saprospiraceae bacterium]|nr:glycosyltransferase family 4 protein [Saprospiraceae bacterium]